MAQLTPEQVTVHREIIRKAEQIRVMMDTNGWKDVAKPILDKMIKDVFGYQREDGRWIHGSYMQSKKMMPDELIAYQMGLIDYNNAIMDFFEQAKMSKRILKDSEKYISDDEQTPMIDSRYKNELESFPKDYGGGIQSGRSS